MEKKKQIRNKRKETLQVDNTEYVRKLESAKKNADTAQFITISDFMAARSFEMSHFTSILRSKTNNKLVIQQLPKHMRRRAMAHNHYRIPVAIRLGALREAANSESKG